MAILRYITVGKRTAGHLALLESKGYTVRNTGEVLEIQASQVIEGVVDLSTPEKATEALSEAISAGAVYSYKTQFQFPDGKVLHGIIACARLGKASALVTKGPAKSTPNKVDDIFDAL